MCQEFCPWGGHVWWGGAWQRGVHGGGHAWQGWGACVAGGIHGKGGMHGKGEHACGDAWQGDMCGRGGCAWQIL